MNKTHVAIIGAGVHGASVAYHLAKRGVEPVVFDRGYPACGPTGASSAVCRAYYTNEFLASVAHEALEMFANFKELTNGRDAAYRRTGALFLHPAEDEQQVRNVTKSLNDIGTTVDLLSADEVKERFPFFDLDGVGFGCWETGAGYADPAGTTDGLIARAVELGARLRLYTPVVNISQHRSGDIVLTTADGKKVATERLLIAAGPWTGPLASQLDIELPVTVERHYVANCAWGGAKPVPFVFADINNGYYFRPEGQAQFILGSLVEEPQADPDDYSTEVTQAEQLELLEAVVKRIPALAECQPRGGWASLYDVSPDWQPIIGEVAPNVFVDCGTSGHGFKLAPALGRHIADLIMGTGHDPGLDQFGPQRFQHVGVGIGSVFVAAKILG